MLAIGCGYPDGNDFDRLRFDPAFKLACGRLPDTGGDLCSQPTLSRLENAPTASSAAFADMMRRHEGKALGPLLRDAGAAILQESPHRVVESALARIEVFTRIPLIGEQSPERGAYSSSPVIPRVWRGVTSGPRRTCFRVPNRHLLPLGGRKSGSDATYSFLSSGANARRGSQQLRWRYLTQFLRASSRVKFFCGRTSGIEHLCCHDNCRQFHRSLLFVSVVLSPPQMQGPQMWLP